MNDQFDSTEAIDRIVETAVDAFACRSIYGEIKRALIARGIPAEEIAFIHDYPTPAKKAKVFAEVNAGKIRVLIRSTEKMGLGSSFQERLIGLHHLTPAFRGSDISQREGRILRQGNIFPEVYICTYVTESSFDAFMWGLIETKARFISQIMAGEVTARTAEDVDQLVLTAAQIKAIASGNPRILEKVALEVELTKLEAVAHESRSTGKITKIIGRYRGFEITAHASGRQLDALSTLFSATDLFLRAGEGELSYGFNIGESDPGILQSMDAQLRGLEGKLEKSLAAQAQLEHRKQQIAGELTKGFGDAARYEELKLRLDALNQELTKAGVEIEDSPEMSNLDEEVFRPIESGINTHQILALSDEYSDTNRIEVNRAESLSLQSSESASIRNMHHG